MQKKEKMVKTNKKRISHKDLTLKERAKLIVVAYNHLITLIDKDETKGLITEEFLLSDKLSKEHYTYFQLHFDEYYCPKCNKKFKNIFEISSDYGVPICNLHNNCWTYPKKLPEE